MTAIILCGPTGRRLPPIPCSRFTPKRKKQVVAAVRGGIVTAHDVCRMYNLSLIQLSGWARSLDTDGRQGSRTTRQRHRA